MYSTTKFNFCILVRTICLQNNDSFNKICAATAGDSND